MFIKVIFGRQTITVPFSSKRIANSFIRGFNEYIRHAVQEKEYPCRDEDERRGARFAENIYRYCEQNNIKLITNRIEIQQDKENQQSLFDGFE